MKYTVDSPNNKVTLRIENSQALSELFLTAEQARSRAFVKICGNCKWNSHASATVTGTNYNGLDLESVDVKITCKKTTFRGASCTNR